MKDLITLSEALGAFENASPNIDAGYDGNRILNIMDKMDKVEPIRHISISDENDHSLTVNIHWNRDSPVTRSFTSSKHFYTTITFTTCVNCNVDAYTCTKDHQEVSSYLLDAVKLLVKNVEGVKSSHHLVYMLLSCFLELIRQSYILRVNLIKK